MVKKKDISILIIIFCIIVSLIIWKFIEGFILESTWRRININDFNDIDKTHINDQKLPFDDLLFMFVTNKTDMLFYNMVKSDYNTIYS